MNKEKVFELLQQVEALSEEEQTFFFELSRFPAATIREGFYDIRQIAKMGGWKTHKSISQLASTSNGGWDFVKIGKYTRIFGKANAHKHIERKMKSRRKKYGATKNNFKY